MEGPSLIRHDASRKGDTPGPAPWKSVLGALKRLVVVPGPVRKDPGTNGVCDDIRDLARRQEELRRHLEGLENGRHA